jgi:hypothetical protein
MKEFTAALILRTAFATVPEITSILRKEPSAGVSRGETPHGGRRKHFQKPYEETAWILRSEEDEAAPVVQHLHALTRAISPQRIREARTVLPRDLRVEIDVAVFSDGQTGQVDFDQPSVHLVMEYEATLNVTTYYSEKEKIGAER